MNNVFKWDADFICIRNNFIELVKKYDLKNRNDKFAIWFTGTTLFENNDIYYCSCGCVLIRSLYTLRCIPILN